MKINGRIFKNPIVFPVIATVLASLGTWTSFEYVKISGMIEGQFLSFLFWGLSALVWMKYSNHLSFIAQKHNRYEGEVPTVLNGLIVLAFFASLLIMLMSQEDSSEIFKWMMMTMAVLHALKVPFYWQEVEFLFCK